MFYSTTDKPVGTRVTSDARNNAVMVDQAVTFTCSAESLPTPQLELLFNNKTLGMFQNGTFALHRVNVSNEGEYQCIPRNFLGTGPTAHLNLTVRGKYYVTMTRSIRHAHLKKRGQSKQIFVCFHKRVLESKQFCKGSLHIKIEMEISWAIKGSSGFSSNQKNLRLFNMYYSSKPF